MTVEAPESKPEQGRSQVDEARSAFNMALFSEYQPGLLIAKTTALQAALLGSGIDPEKTFHELSVSTGQALEKAIGASDEESVESLRNLKEAFELTWQNFRPQNEEERRAASQPKPTRHYPPMTDAKGGEKNPRTQTKRRTPTGGSSQQQLGEDEKGTEADGEEETTFGSFLRSRRGDVSQLELAKRSGKVIGQTVISHLEHNRLGHISADKLPDLAKALNLNEQDTQQLIELFDRDSKKEQ